MGPSCLLTISRVDPERKDFVLGDIINPLLTKVVRSRWLNIGLVLFGVFMDLDFVLVHKNAKKNEANIPPFWTSRLVNNASITGFIRARMKSHR